MGIMPPNCLKLRVAVLLQSGWRPATVIPRHFYQWIKIRHLRNVQKGVTRMCKHSLYYLALISFSMVSNAAAIPMDADQAVSDAIQNAVLHKDVVVVQGGGSDKDVADALPVTIVNQCQGDVACSTDEKQNVVIGDKRIYADQSLGDWFVQGKPGSLQPLMAWLIILSSLVFFLSRKSASTK
jgi:hypothetical protein